MALVLYFHPLASFCHKVLIALYENETPFEGRRLDLLENEARAQFLSLWPIGKIPVLRDESRDQTVPETTITIEYLEQHYPGSRPLLPTDVAEALNTRLWDRFYDLNVHMPMQKIATDRLRADGEHDTYGVAAARATLESAYGMIERRIADHTWASGEAFGLADCAAAPALFFANIVAPFSSTHPHVAAYFERLVQRLLQARDRRSATVLPSFPVPGGDPGPVPRGRPVGALTSQSVSRGAIGWELEQQRSSG
jgi:glutathione S-transferase